MIRIYRRDAFASGGVDLCLGGWKQGLNKVEMTRTLRAGGLGLSQASQATGQLLEGADVRIHLSQFSSFEDARKTLCRVGVEQVTQA
ncbi:hypothetical protein ACFOW6_13390 [Fodinicurvata halophila]|uniref:50S ribosomal protein L15 n=2 Tax=Fodinicurvata halophila TaxID=1419723 RepID=A0ABV8UNA5_9PROT